MLAHKSKLWVLFCLIAVMLPGGCLAQNITASITGTVTDPSGAVVPGAKITLRSLDTLAVSRFTSGPGGHYAFSNLNPGRYELRASARGFRDYIQTGIELLVDQQATVNVKLAIGEATQTVQVTENASLLNTTNATVEGDVPPSTITQLPLMVSSRPRVASGFVLLMPGVSTGDQAQGRDVSMNGGLVNVEEATLDGISMQEGAKEQSGMLAIWNDTSISPDKLSEIKVLTSNYAPQYGNTSSGQIIAVTKSGTDAYHGSIYEYFRNTALNARNWGASGNRPADLENDFGASVGGPFRVGNHGIPLFWSGNKKSYFFVDYEGYRITGGSIRPVISIPSMLERNGDFSDWKDSKGKLIPIYDPSSTQIINGQVVRTAFPGNKIPQADFSPQALGFIKFLPTPNLPGALNNYSPPFSKPLTGVGNQNSWTVRGDQYWRDKDHFVITVNEQAVTGKSLCLLPDQICGVGLQASNVTFLDRAAWDHTFTPSLLNHWGLGYQDSTSWGYAPAGNYASQLPQIAGVYNHLESPTMAFTNGFNQLGNPEGGLDLASKSGEYHSPEFITNDLMTWAHGSHLVKFGGEFRALMINSHNINNFSGTFNFASGETGILGVNSGSPIASFLLGDVNSGSAFFPTVTATYARQHAYSAYVGDTWKARNKLTIDYGVRWDRWTPSWEARNHLVFFDPNGANPAAGGRLGRLAFSGTGYGPASYGARYPEKTWNLAFAPRLGIAYQLFPKTVIRTGYGIFYLGAFYPGDGAGISQDGFNSNPSFGSTNGGLVAAFNLTNGFPQNFPKPPFINSGFDNGLSPNTRTVGTVRLPYSQQWNFTIDHEFSPNSHLSLAYVGNKGTRLPSVTASVNALNPSFLSLGNVLYQQFTPTTTSIATAAGAVSLPYAGWVQQMTSCAPSVAQALLPYPQYCGALHAVNEYAGNSTYHSFQAQFNKRVSGGVWALVSYTASKELSDAYSIWASAPDSGDISPFERKRGKALAANDVPQILSAAFVYDLPFGAGRHWLHHRGVVNALAGGWSLDGIFRASSGTPMFFRSSFCNVPGQFRAACIPSLLPGANPFAQSKSNFDPAKGPLLNAAAFQPTSAFNFNFGDGAPFSNIRNFGYHNVDISLEKDTKITEKMTFKFRAEFFNAFNWHTFTQNALPWTLNSFNDDIASPSFGSWNGAVSAPRVIQFGARVEF